MVSQPDAIRQCTRNISISVKFRAIYFSRLKLQIPDLLLPGCVGPTDILVHLGKCHPLCFFALQFQRQFSTQKKDISKMIQY
jgi:hypothetical protein